MALVLTCGEAGAKSITFRASFSAPTMSPTFSDAADRDSNMTCVPELFSIAWTRRRQREPQYRVKLGVRRSDSTLTSVKSETESSYSARLKAATPR